MINKNYKKAFTLVELLTVVVIIGMIASVALIGLRDTGEVKAKVHTEKVLTNIKDAIVYKESPTTYYPLFINDFGTIPPNPYFLINEETDNNNFSSRFVDGKLFKFRVVEANKQRDVDENSDSDLLDSKDIDVVRFPAPFMETCSGESDHTGGSYICEDKDIDGDGTDDTILSSADIEIPPLYGGYQRSYLQNTDGDKSVLDGWSNQIQLELNLNIKEPLADYTNSPFFNVKSYGSDRMKTQSEGEEYLKDEYNEFKDDNDIKSLYDDDIDIASSYGLYDFMPKGITSIDITIPADESTYNKVAIFIYTPMLYYVEGSDVDTDGDDIKDKFISYNTIQAENSDNSGNYADYTPFLPYHADYLQSDWEGKNLFWQVGIAKYSFIFEDTIPPDEEFDLVTMKINDKDVILDNTPTLNPGMESSYFFRDSITNIATIRDDDTSSTNRNIAKVTPIADNTNPFYMMAGKKYIAILTTDNGTDWTYHGQKEIDFMPNEDVVIQYP